MSAIVVQTPAAVEPLSLAEVKLQLGLGPWEDSDHITSSRQATRLRGLIAAAREYCEVFTRRSFVSKGFIQYLDSFPYYTDTIMSQQAYPPAYYSLPRYSTTLWNYSQMIKLYYSPLMVVDHITYRDSNTQRQIALLPAIPPWNPRVPYSLGTQISDSNGNLQTCTVAGMSGTLEPVWPTIINSTHNDGSVTWTTGDEAPEGSFIVDNGTEPPRIFPMPGQYWPPVLYIPNAVAIYFTAGYSNDASLVPSSVKVAMRQLIQIWDQQPEVMSAKARIPEVDRLLWALRVEDHAPTRG